MNREAELIKILKRNDSLLAILDEVANLNLPNWYITAGSVFQTIWNNLDGKSLMSDVHDIDVIYFDKNLAADSSVSQDKKLEKDLSAKFSYVFDVHNEAFMHLWHGRNIEPYTSSENAMERFLATAHAIGITGTSENITVYAPFGLDDIFDGLEVIPWI